MTGVQTTRSQSQGSASVVTTAGIDAVWTVISDPTRTARFSPENTGARWRGGATQAAVGARFLGFNRRGPLVWVTECVVRECEAPRLFAFEVGVRPLIPSIARWTWLLEPVLGANGGVGGAGVGGAAGTRITLMWKLPAVPGRARRLIWRGMGVADRPANLTAGCATTLRALVAYLESGS